MPPWPDRFARTPEDREALLALSALRSTPPRRIAELAVERRTGRNCLQAVLRGGVVAEAERRRVEEADPDGIAGAVESCGARLIVPGDDEYPSGLEDLVDPPAHLFVRGGGLDELYPRVGVVGARNCTLFGRDMAKDIGYGLASARVTVVSGGARGIDSWAHKGALAAEGPTIAVLGCGIDRAYPAGNRALMKQVEAAGAVVSEYPPGVPPEPFRFPARNRIVAGLSVAVVIVEGAAGSGSLITAGHALDLGRDVYALPGAVNNPLAEAPLELIRDGAKMIRGTEDLLLDLGRLDADAAGASLSAGLSVAEEEVLGCLAGPTLPEQVASRLGWELGHVVMALVELELRGLVRSVGGRFERRLVGAT